MAAAYARLTGKVGVALATLGPGATNFMTCVSYAQLGGIPVMFITGQKPIKESKQGRFQVVEVVEMMKPVTKFSKQIVDGRNVPYLIRETFRLANLEKKGPVHLELPEDIAQENVQGSPCEITDTPNFEAFESDILRAVKMIEKSKMPLLLIASGAIRGLNVRQAIKEFIDKTGIFFFATQMGKGVLDERHERYLGTCALSDHDYIHCSIERADLIINIGHDVVEKPPFFMERGGKKVIHISFFPACIDAIYFPQTEVVGDLFSSIDRITKKITPSTTWDFSYFAKIKEQIDDHI